MNPSTRFALRCLFVAIGLSSACGVARAQMPLGQIACGPVKNSYGPFDYRVAPADVRNLVEPHHFTPDVEALRRGSTASAPGGDLDYTLRVFPNSPRALMTLAHYATRQNNDFRGTGLHYMFECYFDRALRFVPDDPTTHLIYGIYLRDRKRVAEARAQLDQAAELRGDLTNFDFDYNLGLLYYDIGDYDKSADAAKRAYQLGAPFPSLKAKLQAKGKWTGD